MTPRRLTHETQLALVEGVRELLDEEPTLSLDEVSSRLAWTPRSLQRAFRAAGTTFRDEQQARRMDVAATLLVRGTRSWRQPVLREAARKAGFRRARHLSTQFRAQFGITPSTAWRIG
jgi:AraC-like DNA-binding protein